MPSKTDKELLVALDIGTSKIVAIVGEVQVSRKAIQVKAKGGNALSRIMSERQNKDAIVGLILQKAIRREAAASLGNGNSSVVAISRCEVSEE